MFLGERDLQPLHVGDAGRTRLGAGFERRQGQRPHVGRRQVDLDAHPVQRGANGRQHAAHQRILLVGVLGEIGYSLFRHVSARVGSRFQLGLVQRLNGDGIAFCRHAVDLLDQIGESGVADEILESAQLQDRVRQPHFGAVAFGETVVSGQVHGFVQRHIQRCLVHVAGNQVDDTLAVHVAGRAGLGRIGGVQHQRARPLQRGHVALAQSRHQLRSGRRDGSGLCSGGRGAGLASCRLHHINDGLGRQKAIHNSGVVRRQKQARLPVDNF